MSAIKKDLEHLHFRNDGDKDFDFDEYMYYERQRQEYMELLRNEQEKLRKSTKGEIRRDAYGTHAAPQVSEH